MFCFFFLMHALFPSREELSFSGCARPHSSPFWGKRRGGIMLESHPWFVKLSLCSGNREIWKTPHFLATTAGHQARKGLTQILNIWSVWVHSGEFSWGWNVDVLQLWWVGKAGCLFSCGERQKSLSPGGDFRRNWKAGGQGSSEGLNHDRTWNCSFSALPATPELFSSCIWHFHLILGGIRLRPLKNQTEQLRPLKKQTQTPQGPSSEQLRPLKTKLGSSDSSRTKMSTQTPQKTKSDLSSTKLGSSDPSKTKLWAAQTPQKLSSDPSRTKLWAAQTPEGQALSHKCLLGKEENPQTTGKHSRGWAVLWILELNMLEQTSEEQKRVCVILILLTRKD